MCTVVRKEIITVKGRGVALYNVKADDYLSLTDIARYRNNTEPSGVINAWMRNYSTVEFIGLWETVNNPDFKPIEFERFKAEAGRHFFALSPQKWIFSMINPPLQCGYDFRRTQ